ncbi:hypothetical protein JMJ77_0006576, partial [Colletotrichum scovillei]
LRTGWGVLATRTSQKHPAKAVTVAEPDQNDRCGDLTARRR